MDFWRAAQILNTRKWLILMSVAATGALTYGATRLTGAKWQASVQLLAPQGSALTTDISSKGGDGGSSLPLYGPSAREASESQASTFEAIVKSKPVLEGALEKVHDGIPPPDLLSRIDVKSISPRLFSLEVTDPSSAYATALANSLADELVKQYRELTTAQAERVVTLLQQQVDKADDNLTKARKQFDTYRAQRGLVGNPLAPGATNSIELALARLKESIAKRDQALQQVADLQAQLNSKERQLAGLPEMTAAQPYTGPDSMVLQMQGALAQSEVQLSALRSRYNDQYPAVKQALAERDALKDGLKRAQLDAAARAKSPTDQIMIPNPVAAAARQEIAALKEQMSGYEAQAKSLDGTIAAVRTETEGFRGVDSTLSQLWSEVLNQTENRANLVARLTSARMAVDVAQSQNPVTIVSRVSDFNPAIDTTAGRSLKLLLMAAFSALLLTSGIVVALDSIDQRVRNVRQAENALPARILAAIPEPTGPVGYSALARATEVAPQSLQSESFRFLGLHLLSPHGPRVKSLMVLSAKADQGSTTALTNLAITLAQAGKRVVAVDANVRTAELHHVFGLPNGYGFTDLLQTPGTAAIDQALHETTVPNLQVITSGSIPRNPWELFRSANLGDLAHELQSRADYVLYDTPSALLFTDALNLAPVVDAAFLVVRAQESLTGAEERLVGLLEQHDVPVLGSVLSDVPASVVEGYHNYQHYYGPAADQHALAPAKDTGRDAAVVEGPIIDLPKNVGANSRSNGSSRRDG